MAQQYDGRWPQTGDKPATWETRAAAMIAIALAGLVGLALVLPTGLVVPAFAIAAIAAGGGISLYAWLFHKRQEPGRITAWDVANSCVFLGFAAGVLGDPQHVADIAFALAAHGQ